MFIGVVPMILALAGYLQGSERDQGQVFFLLAGALAILAILTLYAGGLSLWYLFAAMPGASAIRAMTRIILVFLFPIAYFCAVAIDTLIAARMWGAKALFAMLIPLFLLEASSLTPYVSPKAEWRSRVEQKRKLVPDTLSNNSILFFAQTGGPFFADELDALWVALLEGYPTLNGYSGLYPPRYRSTYGDDCSEVPRRILSYAAFRGDEGDATYRELMRRVVPIGFAGCDQAWWMRPPAYSAAYEFLPIALNFWV